MNFTLNFGTSFITSFITNFITSFGTDLIRIFFSSFRRRRANSCRCCPLQRDNRSKYIAFHKLRFTSRI